MAEERRAFDLTDARPDGWFDQIAKQSPELERACSVVGRNTLALGLVAGARVTSLAIDARFPDLTTVEFTFGANSESQSLSLTDFRRHVAEHLLRPLQSRPLPSQPSTQDLQGHIGGRYLLVASLFEVKPIELRCHDGGSEITVEFSDVLHDLALQAFHEVIDERVRTELSADGSDDAGIDLDDVERAKEANAQGDWTATISLLSPWLQPVAIMLRSGERAELSEQVHEKLSTGLGLLGTAYSNVGEYGVANEVLRLGVQWAGDSPQAVDLFVRLGESCIASAKYGEAIGLLSRALKLGADSRRVLPLLVRCFTAREQYLAALICARRAREAGVEPSVLPGASGAQPSEVGAAWNRFQSWLEC